ncbi:MAG: hypothetical protein EBU93_07425, partial [Chlamydiae bacterium]|nr:hypothetical protein [Chlamydiota bacterium]
SLNQFEKVQWSHIRDILHIIDRSYKSIEIPGFETIIKLMHRIKPGRSTQESTLAENEGLLMCMYLTSSDPKFKSYKRESERMLLKFKRDFESSSVVESARNFFKACLKDYGSYFEYVNATKGSTHTDAGTILSNFKADVKKQPTDKIDLSNVEFKPIKPSDESIFNEAITTIQNILRPNTDHNGEFFDEHSIRNSKVLSKLSGSIVNFIEEKRHYESLEIILNEETMAFLKRMISYLEFKIFELKNNETEMAQKLLDSIGPDTDPISTEHSLEVVQRLMHQRKSKTFNSLYACYQKLSVACIQEKFPQFKLDKCKELLIESMHYYSTHILLEFFSTILEKVENFVKLSSQHKTVSIDEFMLFLDEARKVSDLNERLKTPSILNFEYRS